MFRSIRSRLTLSFAAIALLSALALGAALLTIVQSYYAQREQTYLRGNADTMANVMVKMLLGHLPRDEVQSQVNNLAFLSQTRVRVFDSNSQLLYDSGVPQTFDVALGAAKQKLEAELKNQENPQKVSLQIISINDKTNVKIPPPQQATDAPPAPDKSTVVIYRSLAVTGSPFGFELDASDSGNVLRSSQVAKRPIMDSEGKTIGSILVSDGPALGRDILSSVAWGWALASAVAVLLAGAVGWFISRRISAPVLVLTDVTMRMAAGELSSRAKVTSRDEFGQLARSFNEMADQVETTVTSLRRFVSDAAHELQTPLTALRANLDLTADENTPDERRVFLERAQATVERLEELTYNLLDLSRLEANGHQAHDQVVSLTELLQQRSEVYASQAEQAGLNCELEIPPKPVCIRADTLQTLRAMDNLVENACKFTPSGGTISIRLEQTDGRVIFSVADTGIGVPSEDLHQLFNRFHRGRNATAYRGSGLGLAIVKAIVEQQGGVVTAENLSPGARFTLKWPLAQATRT